MLAMIRLNFFKTHRKQCGKSCCAKSSMDRAEFSTWYSFKSIAFSIRKKDLKLERRKKNWKRKLIRKRKKIPPLQSSMQISLAVHLKQPLKKEKETIFYPKLDISDSELDKTTKNSILWCIFSTYFLPTMKNTLQNGVHSE